MTDRSGLLVDRDILTSLDRGELIGLDPSLVQPASCDVRLGSRFLRLAPGTRVIDPHKSHELRWAESDVDPDDTFVLPRRGMVLAETAERISLPNDIAAQLGGKSSLARLGIQVHATAGWVDPGFAGTLTLEISNVLDVPVLLRPADVIGQLTFWRARSQATNGYAGKGGKYMNQSGPQPSRYSMNEWINRRRGNSQ